MFERYTEGARRTIFFARYEASSLGWREIEVTHLLLGLLREGKGLFTVLLPKTDHASVHQELLRRGLMAPKISTSIDLPLTNASKRALAFAAEEAERLNSQPIGIGHLLLGLLREKHVASELLKIAGADLNAMRESVAKAQQAWDSRRTVQNRLARGRPETVEIHGMAHDAAYIRESAKQCRERSWHWEKMVWKNRSIVVHRKDGKISFDLSLASKPEDFELVEGAWKKDNCTICHWQLLESDKPEQGTGYFNGVSWLCGECYERFVKGSGHFSSSFSDVT